MLLDELAATPLHPAMAELESQRTAQSRASGSVPAGSSASIGSDSSSSSKGSGKISMKANQGAIQAESGDGATPSSGLESNDPGRAASDPAGGEGADSIGSTKRTKTSLLDCINIDNWISKRNRFESSCDEVEAQLSHLMAEFKQVEDSLPRPYVLEGVHLSLSALYRLSSLLRNIATHSLVVTVPKGVSFAGPSPIAVVTNMPYSSSQKLNVGLMFLRGCQCCLPRTL